MLSRSTRVPRAGVVAGALLCAAVMTAGARNGRLQFRTGATIAEAGLSVRVMKGAEAKRLPSPPVHVYRDAEGHRFDCYAPRDLWFATQARGCWVDGEGNRLVVGEATAFLPRGFREKHVLREEYERAAAAQAGAAPANAAGIARWVEDFADAPVAGAPRTLGASTRLAEMLAFTFKGSTPARIGYAFRLRPNPFKIDPNRWFFVLFELGPGGDPAEAAPAIEREFLPAVAPIMRQDAEARRDDRWKDGGPATT